jgi:hypothetical protein
LAWGCGSVQCACNPDLPGDCDALIESGNCVGPLAPCSNRKGYNCCPSTYA